MNNTVKWILIALAIIVGLAFAGYKYVMNSGVLDALNPEAIEKIKMDVQALKGEDMDFKGCIKSYNGDMDGMKGIMQYTLWGTACSSEFPLPAEVCANIPENKISNITAISQWATQFCTEAEVSNIETCSAVMAKLGPRSCGK